MSETGEKRGPKNPSAMERRRHIRLSLMGLGHLTVPGRKPQEVYMGCIGRGGAGLYMSEELKSKQLVVLDLEILEEEGMPCEMKFAARVRYCVPVGALFNVGLKFEKMSDERYGLLLRHLKFMKETQL